MLIFAKCLLFISICLVALKLPNVGPILETGKDKIKLLPKTIRRLPPSTPIQNAFQSIPKKTPLVREQAKKPTVSYTDDEDSIYTYDSYSQNKVNRINRPRTKVSIFAKKVKTTLLYKPKYPAYPAFNMCHLKDFEVAKGTKLGKGGFGNVFLGRHSESGVPVAIKLISAQSIKKSPKHVEFEETIHARLYNPFIAKFYCTMADPDSDDIYFAIEYVSGDNLAKRISKSHPISHTLIQRWIAEIVLALEYLHDQCIVYRDLKAENVIIDENDHAKLIDFGLSVHDCDNMLRNVAGTLEYTSPEMASKMEHGRAIDYYGLGVLLYTIKAGRLPLSFKASKMEKKDYLKYIASNFRMPLTDNDIYDDLISHLCDRNPDARWGLSKETRKLLRYHEFFGGFDWKEAEAQVANAKQHSPIISYTTPTSLKDAMPLDRFILSGEVAKHLVKK